MKVIHTINIDFEKLDEKNLLEPSAFEYINTGDRYISSSSDWGIQNKSFDALGLQGYLPPAKKAIVIQDKLLYRYPKLNLPRQKLDLIKDKFNCKITRDINKSDIQIISVSYLESLIKSSWSKTISFPDAFKILKFIKESGYLNKEALEKVKSLVDIMLDDRVILNLQYPFATHGHTMLGSWKPAGRKNTKTSAAIADMYKKTNDFINSNEFKNFTRDLIVLKENVNAYGELTSANNNLVLDNEISDIIDGGLAVLDITEHDTIKAMICSDDIDNRSLALEMLANCNIDKSFDVVSSLYYWHYNALKETNNWSTINIKTFRKRMSAYEGPHNIHGIENFERYIKLLIRDNKLTQYAVDQTRTLLHKTLLNMLVGPNAGIFTVDLEDLKVKDEFQKKILLND
jgi:hypothetical protein